MNILSQKWTLLLFFIVPHFFASGVPDSEIKIHVAVNGSDLNPGTVDRPLATLSGAFRVVKDLKKEQPSSSPVEIIVGDGAYFLPEPLVLDPGHSGTASAPLVVKAAEGARPVIWGGKEIQGFEKLSETLWRIKITETLEYGWSFDQLYVNGTRAVRAKSPNQGFYLLSSASEVVLEKGEGRSPELAVQKLSVFPDGATWLSQFPAENSEQALITFYHKWNTTRKRVAGFDRDSSFLFTFGQGMKPWNLLDGKTRYVFENFRAALDTCGEWFLDRSGYLFYMPKPGVPIENTRFAAPVEAAIMVDFLQTFSF